VVGVNTPLSRYDRARSYQWNYDHAPNQLPDLEVPPYRGSWRLCGLPVNSPLGIPAGPLLNGRWCLYYARLGFDLLTYKTVRSGSRPCYELPNLLPVACATVDEHHPEVDESPEMNGSWAVSFGMPSSEIEVWQRDIRATKAALAPGQLLSVSVVGTIEEGWDMRRLADDYARCAQMAADAGADMIEANFSCPNVSTCDGQLFQQPDDAGLVAKLTRDVIGQTPFVAKVGHLPNPADAQRLIESIAPFVNGVAMTNSIATQVRSQDGHLLFSGQKRGICGKATHAASVRQTESIRKMIDRLGIRLDLIGVGGASTAADVQRYLDAGAQGVHMATAAMIDPLVAVKIRQTVQHNTQSFPSDEKN